MAICVIIRISNIDKIAVKTSNFSSYEYGNDGEIYSFTYKSKKYVLTSRKENYFGWLDNENFDRQTAKYYDKTKTGIVTDSDWRIKEFKSFTDLILAQNGDIIEGVYKTHDQNGYCRQKFRISYSGSIPINFNINGTAEGSFFECDTFGGLSTQAGKFYNDFKDIVFWDTNQTDVKLISEISSLLKTAGENVALAFLNFSFENVNFSTSYNSGNGYSNSKLKAFKENLIVWVAFFEKSRTELKNLSDDEALYVLLDTMYYYNMYEALTADEIIRVLKVIAEKGHINNWKLKGWDAGFRHEEDIVIRLLKSVLDQSNATILLEKLENTKTILFRKLNQQGQSDHMYSSLYKVLMYRMDDYGGDNNFTNYINEIERLIKIKNNIQLPITIDNVNDLFAITVGDFCYREKGAKRGRINFEVENSASDKIKIKETIVTKTDLIKQTIYDEFAPDYVYYEEVISQTEINHYEFNHLDLISIFFYDNPSFIDLSQDINQQGTLRITFAGYFEYLSEKQNTANIELIVNTSLFIASLAIGFGELFAAVRTINYSRAFVGILVVASDTAGYLSVDTAFHNYLVSKYGVQKTNEIISNLAFISTYVSVSTGTIIANGGLKIYSKEESLRFVGTGEAILKDSDALLHLNPQQIVDLKNAVKLVKNELYALRKTSGATVALNTIIRTKGSVLLYKFPLIKNELEAISETSRFRFFDDFGNIELDFIERLSDNPKYIEKWNNYTDTQKISAKLDKWSSIENEIINIRHEKLYQRINLEPLLDSNYVLTNYGAHQLSLVNDVEARVNQLLPTYLTNNEIRQHQLVSGMVDTDGLISELFTNYTKIELEPGAAYEKYLNNLGSNFNPNEPYMHPNFKQRFVQTSSKRNSNMYNLDNPNDLLFTGSNMVSHAECRALNDLTIKKFGSNIVETKIYDKWLKEVYGYNRNFLGNENGFIMHTCADCFYLTDIVTFIK